MAKASRRQSTTGDSSGTNSRKYVSQSEFPQVSLEKAMRIASCIWNDFAGDPTPPHKVAFRIDMVPTSGGWRNLCGSSIAYGLTDGGYSADEIQLTDLGRRIVAPLVEGEDTVAKVEALMTPRVMREFYQKYDKAKFPRDELAKNVLFSLSLPKERAESALAILKENAEFTGISYETKTGRFLAINFPKDQSSVASDSIRVVNADANLGSLLEGRSSIVDSEPLPRRHSEAAVAEFISPSNSSLSGPLRRDLEIDVYTLRDRLGAGFSAEVWSALVREHPPGIDLEVNTEVAIKVFHSYAMALPDQVVRVEREFRIAQQIRHKNLVRIYEFMLASRPHHCFLVMDRAKGSLLREHVSAQRLSSSQSMQILLQLANAIGALHSAGAIHRDIKPSNISVDLTHEIPHATLLDLGIVSVSHEKNVTVGSRFVGSKHWAPLEQLLGQPLDERSDIYSLGAVAYHLFTGHEPFSGSATEAAIAVQMSSKALQVPQLSAFPATVISLINDCLNQRREHRPRSVVEIINVLESNI